jgi:hypothetical protein
MQMRNNSCTMQQTAKDSCMNAYTDAVNVLHKLFGCLDERRYDDLLELFADDARWYRKGTWRNGRDEILASLNQRSATQRIAHVITNSYVVAHDPESITLASYMTTFQVDQGCVLNGPVTTNGPASLFKTQTVLVLKNGGWRIARQAGEVLFKFAAPNHAEAK